MPFWLAVVCDRTRKRSWLTIVMPSIVAPGAARLMFDWVETRQESFQPSPSTREST
jgi:hypothetical protein